MKAYELASLAAAIGIQQPMCRLGKRELPRYFTAWQWRRRKARLRIAKRSKRRNR